MKRRSYDTAIKHLIRLKCEACIPKAFLTTIPVSNLYRWRKEADGKYEGCELNEIAQEKLELIQQFAQYREAQSVFIAYVRIMKTMVAILVGVKQYQQILNEAKEQVIEVADRVSTTLPIKKVIKVFGISRATFQSWWQEVRIKCDASELFRCRSRYPFQLTHPELNTMKQLLTDPKTSHWPIISIVYHAARNGQLIASAQTWYRYNKLLGLNRRKVKPKHKQKPGLRASRPNQYWHADITVYKTLDRVKHYIYLVVDNFSRKTLSCRVENRISGLVRMETLRDAWEQESHRLNSGESIDLIVDGGPENVNRVVDAFVNREDIQMNKLVALEDIAFSNSMVEATNKEIKYRYLFPNNIPNGKKLRLLFPDYVHEFNELRPHGQLNYLTPSEAHAGKRIPDGVIRAMLREAQSKRPAENRKSLCWRCS